MNIRQKISSSFLVVILLFMLSLLSVFIFHVSSLKEYKKTSDTLILENSLSDQVNQLIDAYNGVIIAPKSNERMAQYNTIYSSIANSLSELDAVIVGEDSRIAFRGLNNVIRSILADSDVGLHAVTVGDIVTARNQYTSLLSKKSFVTENTSALTFTELQYLKILQKDLQTRYEIQLFVVTIWTAFLIFLAILYSIIFSKRIIAPLVQLSRASVQVATGDYDYTFPKILSTREDEVGDLARSLADMLSTLNLKITQIEEINHEVLETKKHLEERNNELEQFNRMVVGREMKMMELKEKIIVLETRIQELEGKT